MAAPPPCISFFLSCLYITWALIRGFLDLLLPRISIPESLIFGSQCTHFLWTLRFLFSLSIVRLQTLLVYSAHCVAPGCSSRGLSSWLWPPWSSPGFSRHFKEILGFCRKSAQNPILPGVSSCPLEPLLQFRLVEGQLQNLHRLYPWLLQARKPQKLVLLVLLPYLNYSYLP